MVKVLRNIILAFAAVGLVAFVVLVRPRDLSEGGSRTVIRIWHVWGGPMLESYQRGVEQFDETHDDIACKLLYVPNDLSNSQKFFTAVVGDCAPEVAFVDGPQVASWAERGLLLPLDDLLADQGIDAKALSEEFFPPCWRQCVYEGKVYAITYCADPNFVLFWNKELFRKAIADGDIPPGTLDPDKPPRTLEELELYNRAITKYEGRRENRRLVRIGLVPWGVYGNANSLFTWGWAFGGEFYDEKTRKVTADHPKVIEALKWMCDFAKRYPPERIAALQSSFGTAERNPFIMGRQAIQLYHLSGLDDLDKYAPNVDFGIAPIPAPAGGEVNSSWVGGWTMAIPSTVKDSQQRKAALEYILWTCASREGTAFSVRTKRNFPAWRKSNFFDEAARDPRLKVYVDILRQSRHQRPVMPAQSFLMDQLDRAVDHAIHGDMTPEEALRKATEDTQKELDRVLRRRGRGK